MKQTVYGIMKGAMDYYYNLFHQTHRPLLEPRPDVSQLERDLENKRQEYITLVQAVESATTIMQETLEALKNQQATISKMIERQSNPQ